MIATQEGRIIRLNWEGVEERDYALDLKRIPFSVNQQVSYGKWSWVDRAGGLYYTCADDVWFFFQPSLF